MIGHPTKSWALGSPAPSVASKFYNGFDAFLSLLVAFSGPDSCNITRLLIGCGFLQVCKPLIEFVPVDIRRETTVAREWTVEWFGNAWSIKWTEQITKCGLIWPVSWRQSNVTIRDWVASYELRGTCFEMPQKGCGGVQVSLFFLPTIQVPAYAPPRPGQ